MGVTWEVAIRSQSKAISVIKASAKHPRPFTSQLGKGLALGLV